MNRVIKFRAWDGEKMWKPFDMTELLTEESGGFDPGVMFLEFTGLHDKNGKEIYEGDVFRLSEGHPHWIEKNMEAVFYEGSFCIKVIGHDYHFNSPTAFLTYFDGLENHGFEKPYGQYLEVIGNIYEHPNLIP